MNLLSEGRKALIAQLQTITVDNGYLTNAGHNVKSGWFNEVLQDAATVFPIIVVQPGKGLQPTAGPGALMLGPGFKVVGAVSVGLDYEYALDDLQLDLIRCLMPSHKQFPKWLPLGVNKIQLGAPEAYPPGEGVSAAAVLLPVNLSTIVEGI